MRNVAGSMGPITSFRALPWLESFAVGDKRIDAEHRALLDACNDLCTLAERGLAAQAGVTELVATVEAHFANEESLFQTIRYAGTPEHVRAHDSIRTAMLQLLSGQGEPDLAVALGTVRLILVEHIVRFDLGFKTHVLHRAGL